MAQYFSYDSRIFNTGDDPALTVTLRTGEHVDAEDSAHQFSPEQIPSYGSFLDAWSFVTHGLESTQPDFQRPVYPKCMASLVFRFENAVMVSREGCYLSFLKGPGCELAPQTGLRLFLPKIGLGAYLAKR